MLRVCQNGAGVSILAQIPVELRIQSEKNHPPDRLDSVFGVDKKPQMGAKSSQGVVGPTAVVSSRGGSMGRGSKSRFAFLFCVFLVLFQCNEALAQKAAAVPPKSANALRPTSS